MNNKCFKYSLPPILTPRMLIYIFLQLPTLLFNVQPLAKRHKETGDTLVLVLGMN